MTDLWQALDDETQQRLLACALAFGVFVIGCALGWFVLANVLGDT